MFVPGFLVRPVTIRQSVYRFTEVAASIALKSPRGIRANRSRTYVRLSIEHMITNLQTDASAILLPSVGYPTVMHDEEIKGVLASNLRTLIDYAKDRRLPYGDAKSLGAKAGLTGTTVGRWLKGSHAAQIDKLEALAGVFKLRAWQLLIPNLDPSNPPAVPYTDAERRLYWRIKAAARELAQGSAVDEPYETDAGPGNGSDSNSQSPTERPRKDRQPKT